MKKIGKILLKILIAILFVVVVIPFLAIYFIASPICNLIATPIKKSKYKKSNFYKDFGIKFSDVVYQSYLYTVYEFIKANPNIQCVLLENQSFLLKNDTTVVAICTRFDIFHDGNEWKYTDEDKDENKEIFSFLPYCEEEKAKLGEEYKDYKLRMLCHDDDFLNESELEKAKNDDIFLVITSYEDYEKIVL